MDIIINRVALWSPKLGDGLTARRNPIGTKYRTKDSSVYQISKTPVYRFAKNYELGGEKYCLFARTLSDEPAKVENDLDKVAKKIDKAYITRTKVAISADPMNFEYTDYYVLEDKE